MSLLDRAPHPAFKWLARLPLLLYRLHLGRLLGRRFLVIVHRGRRTGRLYRTVVEVIGWDPVRAEAIVASGWGERANWYRNLQAAPATEVLIAGRRFTPQQRFLEPEERVAILRAYVRDHPRAAGALGRFLGLSATENGLDVMAERLPMVAFRPGAPDGSNSHEEAAP